MGQRHHKEDVIIGGVIGFSCAAFAYLIYWPNPFSSQIKASGVAGQARYVYGDNNEQSRAEHFELAQMHDEEENSVLYDTEAQLSGAASE